MSFSGRRPIIILSLLSAKVLSTVPSKLKISFAIASSEEGSSRYVPGTSIFTLRSQNDIDWRRFHSRKLSYSQQYHRNIIISTSIIGCLHQLLRRQLKIGLQSSQRHFNVLICQHAVQAVRAKQEDVVLENVV